MPSLALKLRVVNRKIIADGVVLLRLKAPGEQRLPDWTPGAHITLDLPPGPRCYSLCGDRWDPYTYTIAVRLDQHGDGGSKHIHRHLPEGSIVFAAAPRNSFPLVPSGRYLFIAGGIGITPLIPMIDQARVLNAAWALNYTGSTRAAMPFLDRLDTPEVTLFPTAETGRMLLGDVLMAASPDSAVYVCGPDSLMNDVQNALGEGRRPRIERFRVTTDLTQPSREFYVTLARSARRLKVPASRSLRDVLVEHGVDVPGACLQGVCGACRLGVLRGQVAHGDLIRDPEARASQAVIHACVSRSRGTGLVLDA